MKKGWGRYQGTKFLSAHQPPARRSPGLEVAGRFDKIGENVRSTPSQAQFSHSRSQVRSVWAVLRDWGDGHLPEHEDWPRAIWESFVFAVDVDRLAMQ